MDSLWSFEVSIELTAICTAKIIDIDAVVHGVFDRPSIGAESWSHEGGGASEGCKIDLLPKTLVSS
jgi:hypothetical protein